MRLYHKILLFLRRQPRYISWLIKSSIVLLFALLLWYDIFQRENFPAIQRAFLAELRGDNLPWLFAALALMPLNWLSESMKWWHLVTKIEPFSFWKTNRAVISGVTFSLFFPNRTGEFGGRILYLKPQNAVKGVLSTFVGSWAQQLVLITFGFFGFAYFLITVWQVDTIVLNGVVAIGLMLVGLMLLMFLNLELTVPVFKKIRLLYRFPRLIKNVNVLRQYSRSELMRTLFWALVRYTIYSVQYYFMLHFFGIDVPILRGASCIATIYLLQTSIPLPPIVGLMARGEVALQIWGMYSENEISILATTFSLWILNLILPAFVGLFFIINANLTKSLGYEKDSDNKNHPKNENPAFKKLFGLRNRRHNGVSTAHDPTTDGKSVDSDAGGTAHVPKRGQ